MFAIPSRRDMASVIATVIWSAAVVVSVHGGSSRGQGRLPLDARNVTAIAEPNQSHFSQTPNRCQFGAIRSVRPPAAGPAAAQQGE